MKTPYIIENIIIVICFTILSITFEKWWIVLLGALFLNIEKKK
jgi:hypothetical protein